MGFRIDSWLQMRDRRSLDGSLHVCTYRNPLAPLAMVEGFGEDQLRVSIKSLQKPEGLAEAARSLFFAGCWQGLSPDSLSAQPPLNPEAPNPKPEAPKPKPGHLPRFRFEKRRFLRRKGRGVTAPEPQSLEAKRRKAKDRPRPS